jgi:Na+/melibiose symporter-like transporter
MANSILVSVALVFGLVAGVVLLVLFVPPEQILFFLTEYGKVLLLVAQVAGIFYAGMTTNIKLGAILILTVLATIIWGW